MLLQDVTSSPLTFAQDLVRHNLVVFRGGEGALQVLPPLVDVIPEARLNLVIYYLKQVSLFYSFLNHLVNHVFILLVLISFIYNFV